MSRTLVPTWILEQVQLMIVLGIPPLTRLQNLSNDLFRFGCEMLGLNLFGNLLGGCQLFRRVCEYNRAVF